MANNALRDGAAVRDIVAAAFPTPPTSDSDGRPFLAAVSISGAGAIGSPRPLQRTWQRILKPPDTPAGRETTRHRP